MKVDEESRQDGAEGEMDVVPEPAEQAESNDASEANLAETMADEANLPSVPGMTQPDPDGVQGVSLAPAEASVEESAVTLEAIESVESAAVEVPKVDVSDEMLETTAEAVTPSVGEESGPGEEVPGLSTEMDAGDLAGAVTDEALMAEREPEPDTGPASDSGRAIESVSEEAQEPAEAVSVADEPGKALEHALDMPETGAPEAEVAEEQGVAIGAQPGAQATEESAEAETAEVDDDRHWYVVHCYSGYENKVRHNLEQRIETMGMKDKIFDVVVPTEEEIEVKEGKRRTVERRVFPGYILVQMIMNEESWYVVRNTPGVTGFVGMGNEPTPLRPEEVAQIIRRMEAEAPRVKVTYKIDQKVRIIDGPFNDFIGTVDDIDMERAKVRVMVSFFGRETPVELDFLQVEKA